MAIRRLLSCLLALAAVATALAQRPDSFPTASTTAYLDELEAYLTLGNRSAAAELINGFRPRFSAYTPAQQALVQETTNEMLASGMPATPYFEDYLAAALVIPFEGENAATFADWHSALGSTLAAIEERRFASYATLLDFSKAYFARGALRESSGVEWYARAKSFDLAVEGGEPVVTFDTLRLVGRRKLDSITVEGSAGRYYPARETFVGERGRVYWNRLGDADTYVTLGRFEVDVTKSLYQADSARMYNPKYFGESKVLGGFVDKISVRTPDDPGTYPRFTSYDNVLEIGDLSEGLTYIGGFRLQGLTVFGDSPSGKPARLELRNEGGKLRYRGVAPNFVIRRGERVVGQRVRSTFFYGADSITHPSVNARFDLAERTLLLTRGERAADRNPFYSSLQDVTIDVDEIKIFVDRDSILIGEGKGSVGKGSTRADITSLQHFSAKEYNRYQNIATYNPLTVVHAVAKREGRVLDAESLAKRIDAGFTTESVRTLYYDMVRDGFIDYDLDSARVVVKDKLMHYVEAAQGRTDFDNLQVRSDAKKTNATFDAQTGEMIVDGVKNLELSRKQRVAIVPTAQQMVLTGDRGIDFDGTLFAGYTVLEGKDFHYRYASNDIRLDSARYFDIYTPQPKPEGARKAPEPIGIGSRIEHLAGSVLIDAPANKSGREDIAIFPSLQTDGPSYIYYDLPSNRDTAYRRDSFYFELDEFSFNSLDAFTDADLRFGGTLYSADIFPPFHDTVYVRDEDRSLGYVIETAPEGWPTYMRKGKFRGKLDLSNSGFTGEGSVQYLTATVASDDVLFLPREMNATADNFDMLEDREAPITTPYAKGRDVSIQWLPYRDSMYVNSDKDKFELFTEAGHTLDGHLILTPSGLMGAGVHDWPAATVQSELLAYRPFSMSSDTMTLAIKSRGGGEVALKAGNINGGVDLDAQRGSFAANDSVVTVELTANRLTTSMNEFDWDIRGERIEFRSGPNELGEFVSTDPERDSLYFGGKTANYELNAGALEVGGVPVVASADALIYPSDGRLTVGAGGEVGQLTNARIVADSLNGYHVIDSATVNIFGRKAYTASGNYRYDIPSRQQTFRLDEIVGERVGKGARDEKATVTRASAEVTEADGLYIDEATRFMGEISLDASRPELRFDGFAKLVAAGVPQSDWFSIQTPGVKDDLQLAYDLPQDPRGGDLHTGIFLSRETQEAYPLLFGPTTTGRDRSVLDLSAGLLDHRPADDAFVVGDSLRVRGLTNRGRIATVDASTGALTASGPLDLGSQLDYISIKSAGTLKTGFAQPDGAEPELEMKVLLSVDLIIPDKLLNLVAADIQASGYDAPEVPYGRLASFLPPAMLNWTDVPTDSNAIGAAKGGVFVLPNGEPEHSFIFPGVDMVYNGEYQSFFSKDAKINVGYINGTPIHKQLEAYIEIKMPGSGDDRLYVYLKSPSEAFYFFGFKQGILNVASSSPRFMESLESAKSKELTYKMDDGELYEIAPINTGSANSFVARVREARDGR